MYNIVLNNVTKRYEYEELIRIFLPEDEFEVYALEQHRQGEYITPQELAEQTGNLPDRLEFTLEGDTKTDKNKLKAQIYDRLSELTGQRPPWGTLTGVRPVKLAGMLTDPYREFTEDYRVSSDKAKELVDIYNYQQEKLGKPSENSAGIYVGIPFCPTRCLYCSFTSNQAGREAIDAYLEALMLEIEAAGGGMAESGIIPESIYIGGGTPTTLDEYQLDRLLSHIEKNINLESIKEFTVEAGRPDTITEAKIQALSEHNIDRISINPQTMKEETLHIIGRNHTNRQIYDAFSLARKYGLPVINCDLIAGLPEETPEDFKDTVNKVAELGAENITVHTLAVKRASKLKDIDRDFHFRQAETVSQMLAAGREILDDKGYRPYYLYRQKHMAGSLENTGYCKDDTFSVYNIRIMEEAQSIIAMGAGGISKVYYPAENRLERVPNVSNYEIYISRIDEMIERKNRQIFNGR